MLPRDADSHPSGRLLHPGCSCLSEAQVLAVLIASGKHVKFSSATAVSAHNKLFSSNGEISVLTSRTVRIYNAVAQASTMSEQTPAKRAFAASAWPAFMLPVTSDHVRPHAVPPHWCSI